MKIRFVGTISCAMAIIGLAVWLGVTKRSGISRTSPQTRMIRDMTDRQVRVPVAPTRVLSLCTSATDTLIRLGQSQRVAAVDEYSRIVSGAQAIPTVGKGSAISREQLIAKGIDLAFIWWFQDDAAATLEQLSIPCVRISDVRLEQVNRLIECVAECMGCRAEAERLVNSLPAVASRPAPEPQTTVYLEMYGPFKTVGQDCYVNDLLRQAGFRNIITDRKGGLLISAEQLILADPSVILFVSDFASAQAISARAGMHDLRADKDGRVHAIDRRWLVAGAGWPQAVEEIRKASSASPASLVAAGS
ncbi:MAG: ABC transporter substrate-binding protein [Phycisphaerae bacterium]